MLIRVFVSNDTKGRWSKYNYSFSKEQADCRWALSKAESSVFDNLLNEYQVLEGKALETSLTNINQ
jgi:hypothetical protein